MEAFAFREEPLAFIRRDLVDRPEIEQLEAEHRFRQYLDLALRIFEAENGSVIGPQSLEV